MRVMWADEAGRDDSASLVLEQIGGQWCHELMRREEQIERGWVRGGESKNISGSWN